MMEETETSFLEIYDRFLSKITDDMFLELSKEETYAMLQELLLSAIPRFEFPRTTLDFVERVEIEETCYNGIESGYIPVTAIIYEGGYFKNTLSFEEKNILSTYMIVEWLGQQLASIENVRMKYSGSDFKFTSQASHIQKVLQLRTDYEREGFHLQRLYKRRTLNKKGKVVSTFGSIMTPIEEEE